jgi:F0F1-type ATP synthase beta subunit
MLSNKRLRRGTNESTVIEVMEQIDQDCVRGIALTAIRGIARVMPVRDTGKALQARSRANEDSFDSAIGRYSL